MEIKQIIVGKLQTNCYLFISQKEMVVIDPGGEPRKILAEIEKTGAAVKYIINTHYHFDHMLANKEIEEATGAKVLIHEDEKKFIAFEPDHFLKEGERIKIGAENLEVIHTPGHSQGSICLLGNGFMFSGDTLFDGSYGRVDFPGGSAEDIAKSLEKLAKMITPEMKVYPGHGQVFKI
ncbi:MAG: MBL fold metallo-hydrolase [Candidatus Paceibacterota bacterium]|jgi:glyoxylase-like metal-dependent hydrolase (beta-lactamase superfamily II)